jgi:hypothetical protein
LGQYRFEGLVASKYKIELSHVSFKPQVLEVLVQNDKTEFIKTLLTNTDVELNEVVVSSLRVHDQQSGPCFSD